MPKLSVNETPKIDLLALSARLEQTEDTDAIVRELKDPAFFLATFNKSKETEAITSSVYVEPLSRQDVGNNQFRMGLAHSKLGLLFNFDFDRTLRLFNKLDKGQKADLLKNHGFVPHVNWLSNGLLTGQFPVTLDKSKIQRLVKAFSPYLTSRLHKAHRKGLMPFKPFVSALRLSGGRGEAGAKSHAMASVSRSGAGGEGAAAATMPSTQSIINAVTRRKRGVVSHPKATAESKRPTKAKQSPSKLVSVPAAFEQSKPRSAAALFSMPAALSSTQSSVTPPAAAEMASVLAAPAFPASAATVSASTVPASQQLFSASPMFHAFSVTPLNTSMIPLERPSALSQMPIAIVKYGDQFVVDLISTQPIVIEALPYGGYRARAQGLRADTNTSYTWQITSSKKLIAYRFHPVFGITGVCTQPSWVKPMERRDSDAFTVSMFDNMPLRMPRGPNVFATDQRRQQATQLHADLLLTLQKPKIG